MNLRFVTIKVLRSAVTLWMVVTFIFIVLRLSGDPIDMLLPDDADAEMINYYMREWGLDRPLHEQYWRYFVAVLSGDFGVSFVDDRTAIDVVVERIPATLQLGIAAFAFSICLGLPLGITAALNRNSAVDRGVMTLAVLGYAIPNFFLGILLILTFSLWLQWLPSSGSETFWHMVMPVITLGTAGMGALARFTRSAMLEVLNAPYMRTSRAKGLPRNKRIVRHALPNAAIPVVTILGFKIGGLISGSLITESIFAWPGVGRLLVTSVAQRDLAVVQALVMLVAFTMVLANLLIDLAYGWIDPRIRASSSKQENEA
ncbi:MAG: ABC transporter permease [Alphaproteobacteria bacterium]|nr:ABC transporter permease [Alphaproteobacteria bacterium]